MVGGYGVSIWMLAVVVKSMPVSVAYAVWSGVGTALVAVVGYAFLGESLGWFKAMSLALIVVGVVGLNLAGRTEPAGHARYTQADAAARPAVRPENRQPPRKVPSSAL